jgi:hypothetical protein
MLRKLKACLRKPLPISYYLRHPFFDELKQPPDPALQTHIPTKLDSTIEHIDQHFNRLTIDTSNASSERKKHQSQSTYCHCPFQANIPRIKPRKRSMAVLEMTSPLTSIEKQNLELSLNKQPKKRKFPSNSDKENRNQNTNFRIRATSLLQAQRNSKTKIPSTKRPNRKKRRI